MAAIEHPQVVRARRSPFAWGAMLWLAGGLFFIFLAVCAHYYDYFPADVRIAHAIQHIDVPGFGGFMKFVNFVGDTPSYIVLVLGFAILFGVLRKGWESILMLFTFAPGAIEEVLKKLVGRPRPSLELTHVSVHSSDPSFPSGHTLKTAAVFLVLFCVIPAVVPARPLRWLLQTACLLFIVAAGTARVYVGAHWPSDTLGSYLLVALILGPPLAVYLRYREPAARYAAESGRGQP